MLKKQFLLILSISFSSVCVFGQNKTLKNIYSNTFKIGAAINGPIVTGKDIESQKIVLKHFNSITLENAIKAALINPQPDVFNYGPSDDFIK